MKWRRLAFIIAAVTITSVALFSFTWWMLPDPFGLVPLQIRLRLPEDVVTFLTTPIPTALPAPLRAPADSQTAVVLPDFPTSTPTIIPTPRPLVNETLPPTFTPVAIATAKATATATATPTSSPTATPTIPPIVRLEGMEVIAQQFNNCGPANLTMVLNFHQQGLNQTEVGNSLKSSYDDRNVSPDEMVAYVQSATPLRAEYYSGGDIELLKHLLASGFPVIVERGFLPSESLGWMGHYLTLFGYDDTDQTFLTMDSYQGPWDDSGRYESYESMGELWEHFNNTFIVVFRPEDAQELSRILGDNYASLNRMWLSSAVKAQERTEQDPENAFAWFNLGTNLTVLGEITGEVDFYDNAALAYDRAREIGLPWRMLWYQFKPYRAYLEVGRIDEVLALTLSAQSVEETHLYRGHALFEAGDIRGAESSYRRALQLNPNFTMAEAALASLTE
ncbi:MAG: C39 family peptidase [Candidatus Promineifilaceae bacterium]